MASTGRKKSYPASGTLGTFLSEWRGYLIEEHRFGSFNASACVRLVEKLAGTSFVDVSLADLLSLTTQEIENAFASAGYSKHDLSKAWNAINRFFQFAVTKGLLVASPVKEGNYPGKPNRTRMGAEDIEAIFVDWDRWQYAVHRAPRLTRRAAQLEILRLLTYLGKGNDLEGAKSVSNDDILRYLQAPHRSGAQSTRFAGWSYLDRFYCFLVERGILLSNPAEHAHSWLTRRLGVSKTNAMSQADVKLLFSVADQLPTPLVRARERVLLHLLYTEMLGSGDIIAMTRGHAESGRFMRRRGEVVEQHKLAAATREAISIYFGHLRSAAPDAPLFETDGGDPLRVPTLRAYVRRLGAAVGLSVTPRDLGRSARNHRRELGDTVSGIALKSRVVTLNTVSSAFEVDVPALFASFYRQHPRP